MNPEEQRRLFEYMYDLVSEQQDRYYDDMDSINLMKRASDYAPSIKKRNPAFIRRPKTQVAG